MIKKKLFSKINFNSINLQIQNKYDYTNNQKKGLTEIIYNKDKKE